MIHKIPHVAAVLIWTGTTSGSQNLALQPTLSFGPGTYDFTITRAINTVTKCAGGGQNGSLNSGNTGGTGGASASCIVAGHPVQLFAGKSYQLVVGTSGLPGTDTVLTNVTDATVLVRVKGGGSASSNIGTNVIPGVAGGAPGEPGNPGSDNLTGAAGGGGGGDWDPGQPAGDQDSPGGPGGDGLNAGQPGEAGINNVRSGGGGVGGGATWAESSGDYGFGGGGAPGLPSGSSGGSAGGLGRFTFTV